MNKDIMLNHEKLFSSYASFDKDSIRLKKEESDIRPEYFRDIDRIIHSLSFTRYIGKTQVFSDKENDNISKRIIHVQLVSKIARTIGRALSLNEDLIEAIALGHDIGHTPYGHVGERFLNELSLKYDNTYFMHNVQSVRSLMVLENNGKGKNLTIQTLDGMLCHNGEFVSGEYHPINKTCEEFIKNYKDCYTDPDAAKRLIPMTLEGCVVRISDIIAYLGRDIEDAVMLGLLDSNTIPENITRVLGSTNKEIVNTIILDIINNSIGKNYIKLSTEVYTAIKDLKKFNYINIYDKALTPEELDDLKNKFNNLFEYLLNVLEKEDKTNEIYTDFLNNMSEEYLETTSNTRKVIDHIAGMTDEYFIKSIKKMSE